MRPKKTAKTAVKKQPLSPEARARIRTIVKNAGGFLAFAGVIAAVFFVSQRYVTRNITVTNQPPVIVMSNRPSWMGDALAQQIVDSVAPAVPMKTDDRQGLIDREKLLAVNPWVRKVNMVRRVYRDSPGDTIEVDCEFRAPIALVRWQEDFWYVDAAGVKLPERFNIEQVRQLLNAQGGPLMRVIDGVTTPPPIAGKIWSNGEIQAGLELLALVKEQSFAPDILSVDVSNYAGRQHPNESQLNLVTRENTQIRWGQPVSSKKFFAEARVDQKLNFLSNAKKTTGRIDMNLPWIDLRFDNPTVPSQQAQVEKEK